MREMVGGQQGDEWFDHRIGRITASRMNDVMGVSKREGRMQSAHSKYLTYRGELWAERLTGRAESHYNSLAMQYGQEAEEECKEAYEAATGEMLVPVGFVLHPLFDWAGASPDALLEGATYECKNPETPTFLEWRKLPGVPPEHLYQIQWQLACTGFERAVFHARDKRVRDPRFQNIIRIVERDDRIIAELEAVAVKLNAEVEAEILAMGLPATKWDIGIPEPAKKKPKRKADDAALLSDEDLYFLDSTPEPMP